MVKPPSRPPSRPNKGPPPKAPRSGFARPSKEAQGGSARYDKEGPREERRPPPSRRGAGRRAAPAAPANPLERKAGEERIAKLLARAGVASRRDVERMIAEGRVALNGEVLTTPATLLKTLRGVTVDGNPVAEAQATRLFLYHKPSGLITAARDPKGRKTIYDALPKDLPRLMPIGRLDLATEGLLLLTNDGEFKRAMELPATGVERTYRARTFGDVTQEQLEALFDGITVEGVHYGRIDAHLERRTGRNQWLELTLTEGKNREVRRVLEALGLQVSRLIRTRYGLFRIGQLQPGEVVEVRQDEVERFQKALKSGKAEAMNGVSTTGRGDVKGID